MISYRLLKAGAEAVANGLQRHGLQPEETVVLMLPTGKAYFFSFFGVLMAGGIPVHIYPPLRTEADAGRQATAWQAAVALRNGAHAFILRHCGEPDLAGVDKHPESSLR